MKHPKIIPVKCPSCPYCDDMKLGFPELVSSGRSEPKVYACPYGRSCKGMDHPHNRPFEFNYFDANGKPIPYEPPKDGKAGYSPQKGRKFSTKNDPWANDPANAPN